MKSYNHRPSLPIAPTIRNPLQTVLRAYLHVCFPAVKTFYSIKIKFREGILFPHWIERNWALTPRSPNERVNSTLAPSETTTTHR